MAAFIVRAKEGEPSDNYCATGSPFSDVSTGYWACRYIKRLLELGITTGYGDGTYRPTGTVTRAEMAAILIRAVEGEPPDNYCATGSPFTDVSADTWACKYIKRLDELEITTGCGSSKYCPNRNVTRAQTAAFLARAFLEMDATFKIPTNAEIIASYDNGIRYWDVAASIWTQMTPSSTNGDIAAGDFTADGKADVASIWSSGLWYQDGATLAWTKIDERPPIQVTAGDVTGDGRDEIIASYDNGIRCWDVAASIWTQMTSANPDGDIAAGDFTGDGKADVASIWKNGLWYQDGAALSWTKVSNTSPTQVTAGDVTGN
jgi:hypothetical protein